MRSPVHYEGRRIEIAEFNNQFQARIWENDIPIISTYFHKNPVAARKRAKAIIDAEDRRRKTT